MGYKTPGEYAIPIGHGIVAAPAAGATVYCGLGLQLLPDVSEAERRFRLPKQGRITRAVLTFTVEGVADTAANNVTVNILKGGADAGLIGTVTYQSVGANFLLNLNMSSSFVETDNIAIRIAYPGAWTTQPTLVSAYGVLYIETG